MAWWRMNEANEAGNEPCGKTTTTRTEGACLGHFLFCVQPLVYGRGKRLECFLMHKYPRAKLTFSWMAQYARMHSHPWLLLKHIQFGCV